MTSENPAYCGILPVNKKANCTSFSLISLLRKRTNIQKIGHAGTLDPFATGVMILLIGKGYTKLSDRFLSADKQYFATLLLGKATDTQDLEGQVIAQSDTIPSLEELKTALLSFQGSCRQIPPMFSAKKRGGKKLYDLARKGIEIERQPISVELKVDLIRYEYPEIELLIDCSKGTYIRTLAHDLGIKLGSYAHLISLSRTKSGSFTLEECVDQEELASPDFDFSPFLRKTV